MFYMKLGFFGHIGNIHNQKVVIILCFNGYKYKTLRNLKLFKTSVKKHKFKVIFDRFKSFSQLKVRNSYIIKIHKF